MLFRTTLDGVRRGRYLLSAGADGSVFVYETQGGAHLTRPAAPVPGAVPPGPILRAFVAAGGAPDVDALDDGHEPTEAAKHAKGQHAAPAAAAGAPSAAPAQSAATANSQG